MVFRKRSRVAFFLGIAVSLLTIASVAPRHVFAQDEDNPRPEQHGRKYKSPPETSHIEVTVLKGFNKKPIDGAHVIFHPVKDGVDEGNLEVKTHQDGKVSIDVIPTGTTYVPGSIKLDTAAITDAADTDAGTGGASGVDVTLGKVTGGTTRTVVFAVKIN